ncbi:hypothetical protein [Anaerorhabdus furcosa]|uniref:DUF4325 domain-containing protein n=1 Tax=Anaerorhabdus furcosa TaxID=118967 RepID=A0A1T4M3K1_9FIRM|nr:hypothetical protein [Anaerorhabdus furcosa]SJZ61294.1 hypothetical protein SAMN02745191_1162 [Anaerorhabdus furcosa]
METNEIYIEFETKSLTRISGNPLGREIYDRQIKGKFDINKLNIVIFPDYIEGVSISFVQGLLSGILENINLDELNSKFKFVCKNTRVQNKIMDSIFATYVRK